MIGPILITKEVEKVSLLPSQLSEWDTGEQAILSQKWDASIMTFESGLNDLKLFETGDTIPMDLIARRALVKIEQMAVELIGGQLESVGQHAEWMSQVVYKNATEAMSTGTRDERNVYLRQKSGLLIRG